MTVLAGLFLVAHGLVHLAVWNAPQPPDAPFDSHRSWLFGDFGGPARVLAAIAALVLVVAGVLVLVGAGLAAPLAAIGAGISLLLVLATFHPWFVAAVAIDVAVIAIALG